MPADAAAEGGRLLSRNRLDAMHSQSEDLAPMHDLSEGGNRLSTTGPL